MGAQKDLLDYGVVDVLQAHTERSCSAFMSLKVRTSSSLVRKQFDQRAVNFRDVIEELLDKEMPPTECIEDAVMNLRT